MITAEFNVVCSKVGGCQELLDGEVRELYDFADTIIFFIDDGEKTGACRLDRLYWIIQAPSLVKFRNWSCLEIEREQFSELLDVKWAHSNCDKLKQAIGNFPHCLTDLSQGALICLVERLWHIGQCMPDMCWDTVANIDQLAIHPTEPIS